MDGSTFIRERNEFFALVEKYIEEYDVILNVSNESSSSKVVLRVTANNFQKQKIPLKVLYEVLSELGDNLTLSLEAKTVEPKLKEDTKPLKE